MSASSLNNIKLTPKQTAIAVAFIIAIIATLLLRLYFSDKALTLAGPYFIASTDATALVAYDKQLYRLDMNGRIQQTITFEDIGLKDRIADIQILDDKRFVVGDWGNKRILLCELDDISCKQLTNDLENHLGKFFKFHYRHVENDIFIADTDRHRILHYDIDNHVINKISKPKQLLYPNHIQFENDSKLYVTDTNHHRIAVFDYTNNSLQLTDKLYRVPETTSNKDWPIHYYLANNQDMYILQANGLLRNADLVYLPVSGQAKKILLPDGADITDMRRMNDKLLLSDRELFALYTLNLANHEINRFGGEELNKIFDNDRRIVNKWQFLADAMLALMILAVVGIIIFIIILAKNARPIDIESESSQQETYDLPPITPGRVTWLAPNPKVRRIFLQLIGLLVVIAVLLYGVILLLDYAEIAAENDDIKTRFIYLAALMSFTFLLIIVNAINNVFSKIGTDGTYIYIRTIFENKKISPHNILYNSQYFVKDSLVVGFRNNMQMYFHDKEQFKSYITPLLKAYGIKTTIFKLMIHMLKNPNKLFFFNTVLIVICCFIIYDMFKHGYLFN